MPPKAVIGRFAPSPTGDLHFGSLVSAVGSYLETKSADGKWLIRVEDIDPPREVSGSAKRIIEDLERFGLVSDDPILYQQDRYPAYEKAIARLLGNGRAYHCACSRKDLPDSGIYPGTCRHGIPEGKQPRSIRFLVGDQVNGFTDLIQGYREDFVEDFIIRRADGLFAYQLAVVVDDSYQGITQVVRGADLLSTTARQIALQEALGHKTPEYLHLPVAISADGKKLSKRDMADPVQCQNPNHALTRALQFLGQHPPTGMDLSNLWAWAIKHWNRDLIPRQMNILPG